MDYFETQTMLEGLFLGFLLILGFIGITQIGQNKKDRKKYEIQQVDLMFGTSAYEIFYMINRYRKENKLKELLVDFTMNKMARQRCEEMIADNSLSHELAANEFGAIIDLGMDSVGENIAYGYGTVSGLVNAWIKSELHNDNMLNPTWDVIGIAVVLDKDERPYYCTIFGNDNEYEQSK